MGLNQIEQAVTEHDQQHPFIRQAGWTKVIADEVELSTDLHHDKHHAVKAEQATKIANRMARLLEVLPGGVVVLNGQGKIQQCNAAAISLLGEPLHGEFWASIIKRAFAPKVDNSQDVSLTNGRLVHISTSPLEDEPGQIILLNDVTETRQLQLKVSHLQRLSAMGEMAARLAHQLRTPLSSALLYLSPLLKDEIDNTLRQNFAQKLHSSISHMERLIKDMLSYSRGDMANTAPVSIIELCDLVEQQFRSQKEAQHYHLDVNNSLDEAYVYGSKDALASALNNLLNNARLACGDTGEISIFTDYVKDDQGVDWVEISVEDNGVGITKSEQDKVLTPFYTTRSSGTGLGLPVVKSIAKAHRGSLWFASDAGQGSTFCIRLPRYRVTKNNKQNQKKEQ